MATKEILSLFVLGFVYILKAASALDDDGLEIPDMLAYTGKLFFASFKSHHIYGNPAFTVQLSTSSQSGIGPLPSWLIYNNTARSLSGVPLSEDEGSRYLVIQTVCILPQTPDADHPTGCRNTRQVFQLKVVKFLLTDFSVQQIIIPVLSTEASQLWSNTETMSVESGCEGEQVVASLIVCASLRDMRSQERQDFMTSLSDFLSIPVTSIILEPSSSQNLKAIEAGFQMISAGPSSGDSCSFNQDVEILWALPCSTIKQLTDFIRVLQHNVDGGRLQDELKKSIVGWYVASSDLLLTRQNRRRRRQASYRTVLPTPALIPVRPTAVGVVEDKGYSEGISSTHVAIETTRADAELSSNILPKSISSVAFITSTKVIIEFTSVFVTETSSLLSPKMSKPFEQATTVELLPRSQWSIPHQLLSTSFDDSFSSLYLPESGVLVPMETVVTPDLSQDHAEKLVPSVSSESFSAGITSRVDYSSHLFVNVSPLVPLELSALVPTTHDYHGVVSSAKVLSDGHDVTDESHDITEESHDSELLLLEPSRSLVSSSSSPLLFDSVSFVTSRTVQIVAFTISSDKSDETSTFFTTSFSTSATLDNIISLSTQEQNTITDYYPTVVYQTESTTDSPILKLVISSSQPVLWPSHELDQSPTNHTQDISSSQWFVNDSAPDLTPYRTDTLSSSNFVTYPSDLGSGGEDSEASEEESDLVLSPNDSVAPIFSSSLGLSIFESVTDFDATYSGELLPSLVLVSPVVTESSEVTEPDLVTESTVMTVLTTDPLTTARRQSNFTEGATDMTVSTTEPSATVWRQGTITEEATTEASTSPEADDNDSDDIDQAPSNNRPFVDKPIGHIRCEQGKLLQFSVPPNVFQDIEDGDTRSLRLSLKLPSNQELPSNFWLNLESDEQILSGLPLQEDMTGRNISLLLTATDSQGLNATDYITVHISEAPMDNFTHEFIMKFDLDFKVFMQNRRNLIKLLAQVGTYFGDNGAQFMSVLQVLPGSLILSWTNNTLTGSPCPANVIKNLYEQIMHQDGTVRTFFHRHLGRTYNLVDVGFQYRGLCLITSTATQMMTTTYLVADTKKGLGLSMWAHVILPVMIAVLVFILIILIIFFCNRRRRQQQAILNAEKEAVSNDRNPIIFPDELEVDDPTLKARDPLVLPSDSNGSNSNVPLPQSLTRSSSSQDNLTTQNGKARCKNQGEINKEEGEASTQDHTEQDLDNPIQEVEHEVDRSWDRRRNKNSTKLKDQSRVGGVSASATLPCDRPINHYLEEEADSRNSTLKSTKSLSPEKRHPKNPPPYWQTHSDPPVYRLPPPYLTDNTTQV